ncbi:hypothetical protein [Paenibacillus sp. 481]|uniref:hypothetical protein n=1 Tax=Paenibacillus sp. 481 TaxID=2835869 RepID=UPI001E2FD2C5|nr:hypothetical protein [Paenibacillus sp. 481]UHA74375.1 hypothetical protein KIK04_04480 [Paenibacillus sp. 481]
MAKQVQRRSLIGLVAVFMLIVWPSYQIFSLVKDRDLPSNASRMLFEVSSFQMDMLHGAITRAKHAKSVNEWNEIKMMAFASAFAHERLANVFSEDDLNDLPSLKRIVDYVTAVQINGERPLKEEERHAMEAVQQLVANMQTVYAGLVNEEGRVLSSKWSELTTLDEKISALLHR